VIAEFSINQLAKEPNQIQLLLQVCSEALSREFKPIVLFGSGSIGRYYLKYLKTMNIPMEIIFCDNNPAKRGTSVEGVPIISFNELKTNYRKSYIIICSFDFYEEISLQLKDNNLKCILDPRIHSVILESQDTFDLYNYVSLIKNSEKQFQAAYNLLADHLSKQIFCDRINYCITSSSKYLTPLRSKSPQYFAPDLIKLTGEEIFIDGGAFTGDTIAEFLKQTKGDFNKIYAFEPEESKHNDFKELTARYEHIELLPYGLWSKKEVLRFHAHNDGTSSVGKDGDIEIPVISIDELLDGRPVTFIKMDIEGVELEALKGAEMSIRKYKPKLAICVYHKPLDIVEIPMYIKKLVPEYKFYFRHYSNNISETVCYAVAE